MKLKNENEASTELVLFWLIYLCSFVSLFFLCNIFVKFMGAPLNIVLKGALQMS